MHDQLAPIASRDPLHIALAVATVLLLAAGGPWLVGRLRHPGPLGRTAQAARPNEKRVTLHVSGMMCSACASRVADTLQSTPGVVNCDVDADASRAYVVCEHDVADTALVAAVARAGKEYAARIVAN